MALAGELAKYIGGELVKNTGKELATNATTSALANLAPKIATKAGVSMANKIGNEMIAGSVLDKLVPTNRMLDKTGKPITFYHSTPNDFDKFDDKMLGSNTGYDNTALGHFVTPDKDFSKRFIDIDNVGKTGRTMELQANVKNPITHPYMAGQKYNGKELDKKVEDYFIATNNQDGLASLRELAEEDGTSLYDAYMDLTFGGDSPFEYSADDRKALLDNGYDAVEIVEGPKSGLVEGSKDNAPVSSYAVFNGENLRPIRHLPINQTSITENIPVNIGERQVSPRVSVAENQASLFDQLDAPSEVKIRALNYLDKPINWADNNPAFNKLTPAQRQSFADLAVKKLGNNPTTYDVNQLFDPFYKNARKETGMALFNSEENQNFLDKLGVKDYTSMRGALANDGEHTYTISNTTGLPHNEKITLNASVMENMLKLQSTELHEAAHAAWLRLSQEQKVSIGQDLCNKLGLEAKVGKRIANSTDLNELIAYSCEANFTSGNMVGSDGKFLDEVLSNSTAQKHLDNVAKMAGDLSPSFKERVMNVIRAFVDYVKAKIKGIKDIGTFDEFYEGLSSGDFAEDMATPIEKWSAPTKSASEMSEEAAKDELFNKLATLQKSREIDGKAFLDIIDMIGPSNELSYIMDYINNIYPDVAKKLTNVVDKRASYNIPINQVSNTEEVPVSILRSLFRGQLYSDTDFSYNSPSMNSGDSAGSQALGGAYHFTPDEGKANAWADNTGGGVIKIGYKPDQLLKAEDARRMIQEAVDKLDDSAYMSKLWQTDPELAEQIELIGIGNLEALAKREGRPFVEHINANDNELGTVYYYKDVDEGLTEKFREQFRKTKAEKYLGKPKLSGLR